MKTLFSFVLGLLLFSCPIAVQAEDVEPMPQEEIGELPVLMSEDALNYLLSEDMYQGTLSWQGNKVSTKFNYDNPKKKMTLIEKYKQKIVGFQKKAGLSDYEMLTTCSTK